MEQVQNPFIISGYRGPSYFCDRVEETQQLRTFINNNVNVTLFALRRLGKTGLIHHVFHSYENQKNIVCIYIDILATQNLTDFINQLATAIYNKFPPEKGLGKKMVEFIRMLRPTLNFDELTGIPTVSITMDKAIQQEKTLQQLFNFLDSQKIKVVIAIDEFQQILEYPEKNIEAILRSHIQQLSNTSFIFCGSNQKIMHELFNSAKRPFFASCSSMHLDFIEQKLYQDFILQHFTSYKKNIDEECLHFISDWTMGHTFYTQYFCNTLFSKYSKKYTLVDAHETAVQILKLFESIFFQYRNMLTESQWHLLWVLSMEEKTYKPHSKELINKYKLGGSSLVSRGIESLLEKELIFYNTSIEKPYYEVYDKFLMRWLQHQRK